MTISNGGEDAEEVKLADTAGRKAKRYATMDTVWQFLIKLNIP